MIEGAYNKTTGGGNGTLVANWQEERSLRDFTGVGRYVLFHFSFNHSTIPRWSNCLTQYIGHRYNASLDLPPIRLLALC